MGTYRGRRAARPQGPAYCTYWVRVPATGVPYVPRTWHPRWRESGGAVFKVELKSQVFPSYHP